MTPQDARSLLERYLTGNCTPGEKELLESWYKGLLEEFPWDIPASESGAIHDRMLSTIKARLGEDWPEQTLQKYPEPAQPNSGRVRRLAWPRYAGAAAAILAITVGSWIWWSRHNENKTTTLSKIAIEANPGGNHAILTLGNGRQVTLDTAANGILAIQGNNHILKQDGQLDYQQGAGEKVTTDNAGVFNTLATPRGGQYKLTLPDGTRVWLDAASSITYPTAFAGKKRQVSITGEAYFEVVHDPKLPFEVSVQGQIIRDIGTSFNINAYTDEPAMKITLANGTAAVEGKNTRIVLRQPGQQAEYRDGQLRSAPDADLKAVLAWKNGLFYLTSADIATVMRQISRWYDVDVVFEKGFPAGHITGEVPRNTMLSTTLLVLQTSGVHFTVEGKKIYVTP